MEKNAATAEDLRVFNNACSPHARVNHDATVISKLRKVLKLRQIAVGKEAEVARREH